MSPCFFNLSKDAVMKDTRERAGYVEVAIWDAKENSEYLGKWLMFANDTVLVGDSEEKLLTLVQNFGSIC